MDTVSSAEVQRWLRCLCIYLATTSYTSVVFTGPGRESSVAASCLPAETSLSYFSPCLWMELLFQLREKHTNKPDAGKTRRNNLLSGGTVSCPSLSIHLQQKSLCQCPFIKTSLESAHRYDYLLLLFSPTQRLQSHSTSEHCMLQIGQGFYHK